ncbi:hypothetical protein SPRG_22076 [Saprolegnia parasitica CBS 223.65]|uniref:Bax inhibitor 1 n=1 Tax=Saprolegnia parasitica (strain CBS 223.65) TaxID=695850 RepID=A0A067D5I8_SAPPC|nr:hypothetical protein SPRG_22076 [Saprolegnia parasitica CBS 223.65]KDO34262.1 hypothetical protein SPRG_22076 [Saprolegnia parasitica CBS 223.65]|eukprot:XP_012195340.1 hypothetical protein SPRG_22076 [Saprolegnia parasitica CBS 223.65]
MQSKATEVVKPVAVGGFDLAVLLSTNDIEPRVQRHLVRVYVTLAAAVGAAAAGVVFDIACGLAGYTTAFLVFVLVLALYLLPKAKFAQRLCVLLTLATCWGANLGGLVQHALATDASIVAMAFVGSTIVFGCFTLSALLERRRTYLFLGAFAGSAILGLVLVALVNVFVRSAAMYSLELYGGLLLFCFYVLFDTQLIVEKASSGDDDVVGHAFELFLDFLNLFVRILIILLKKRADDDSVV